jgi:hypothetical protein
MKHTKLILTTVALAGSLTCSVLAANSAHADWRRLERRDRAADFGYVRQDYHRLDAWRNKLWRDQAHHASRRKLAEDEIAIQRLERDIHSDRR